MLKERENITPYMISEISKKVTKINIIFSFEAHSLLVFNCCHTFVYCSVTLDNLRGWIVNKYMGGIGIQNIKNLLYSVLKIAKSVSGNSC